MEQAAGFMKSSTKDKPSRYSEVTSKIWWYIYMIWDEMIWYDICSCSPFKYQRSNKPRRSPRNMCAMPWKHWTVIHSGECSSAHIHIGIPLCLDWKAWDGWLIMTETHVTWSWHWLSTKYFGQIDATAGLLCGFLVTMDHPGRRLSTVAMGSPKKWRC